jgi:hypothetical protein
MPAIRGITEAVTGNAAPASGVPGAVCHDGGNPLQPDRVPLRELMDDRLLDALLDRSRDEAGGCG